MKFMKILSHEYLEPYGICPAAPPAYLIIGLASSAAFQLN